MKVEKEEEEGEMNPAYRAEPDGRLSHADR